MTARRAGPLDTTPDRSALVIVHVGDAPDSDAGGISRVIRNHLARPLDGVVALSLPSNDPRGKSPLTRQRPAPATLVRLLRAGFVRRRPAVLHVHMSNKLSLLREGAFALLGRLLGWRVCLSWHSSSAFSERRRLHLLALRLAFAPAHVVHVLSEAHASVAPVGRARLAVIPNDVPVPAVVPPVDARRRAVVFAGDVGHRKGADVLLAAWGELGDQVSAGWTLEVFGRVEPALAGSLGQHGDGSVRLHGLTAGPVVHQALLSSAVAVLPSRREALPMFLLEAMAAGCAVVATDVGAIPSVVGEDAGLVVEPGNAHALASALRSVMTSSERRARLAAAARARMSSTYAEAAVTTQWRDLYARLLQ